MTAPERWFPAPPAQRETAVAGQISDRSAGSGRRSGGFFDGIVLQWHRMLGSWYPIESIENLERNTLWDGLFHSVTYIDRRCVMFVAADCYESCLQAWNDSTARVPGRPGA